MRLAYLRGDGQEMVVTPEMARGLKDVAKSLGMRRLVPVDGEQPDPRHPNSRNDIWLPCTVCGGAGQPYQMLANIDGKPFASYEHERCPRGV
jgi:hypothetical protein